MWSRMESLVGARDSASSAVRPRSKPRKSRTGTGGRLQQLLGPLFDPVDIASLVFFRVAFGLIMVWEVWRYFTYGWIANYYIDPVFHFTYYGFGWIQPWAGNGMYWHFIGLGVLAAFLAAGFLYRISATLFFLGFTYVFLLDQAQYLNHFYLVSLIALILIFVPAHRAFSVDAWLRPRLRSRTTPLWAPALLAAQMGIVYFYGGIAKLGADWLRGEPMRAWMAWFTDPLGGPTLTYWSGYFFSYGGLLFDLLIVPFLIWRRTRIPALMLAVGFHLANAWMFNIGIFPWFAIAATLMFLHPSWPRRALNYVRNLWRSPRRQLITGPMQPAGASTPGRYRNLTLALLAVFLVVQLVMPLRHFAYPGNANWTEEGHRFAWHMKLRSVEGAALFNATDPVTGQSRQISPASYLTERQEQKMAPHPDMVLQLAHRIADDFRAEGYDEIQVSALVVASLNGREAQLLIDPQRDLAAEPRTLAPDDWILPLEEPFRVSTDTAASANAG